MCLFSVSLMQALCLFTTPRSIAAAIGNMEFVMPRAAGRGLSLALFSQVDWQPLAAKLVQLLQSQDRVETTLDARQM